jgi:hypothetical protein
MVRLSGEIKMAKIGRNSPCPCGSGKKYKRCCLGHEYISSGQSNIIGVETELDRMSNSVLDFIKKGDLDEAEHICNLLSEKYPDQVDGIMRLVEVYEARGSYSSAAVFAQQTATFMRDDVGYDSEQVVHYENKAKDLKKKAAESHSLGETGATPLA